MFDGVKHFVEIYEQNEVIIFAKTCIVNQVQRQPYNVIDVSCVMKPAWVSSIIRDNIALSLSLGQDYHKGRSLSNC